MGKNPNKPDRKERRKRLREKLKRKKSSINIRRISFGIGAAALLVALSWVITHPNSIESQKKTADLIAKVRQCIGRTINDDTGLGLWERDEVMTTAGIIVDGIRYIVRSSEVTPSIIQLESTPRDMRRRNEGKIYRDAGLDGTLDAVLQGGTLTSAVPIQTSSADSDEFFEGLQAVAEACDSERKVYRLNNYMKN